MPITTSPSGGGTPTSITNGGGTVSVGLDGSIAITAAAAKNVTLTGTAFALEADVSDPNTLTTTAVLGHRFWVGGTGVEVDTLDILPAGITVLGKALLFGGNFTTSGASALTLTTTGATNVTLPTSGTLATQAYVDTAVLGLLDFKGSQDCSANPNYPSALKGDVYMVSVAGKIGGASGTTVEAGDLFTATADNAGGTQAGVGTSWVVTQANVVLGTNVATALAIAVGSAGAIVVNGGVLGTPSSGTLTNCTGLPNASVTGLGALATVTPGTGVATAAAIAVNTAGGPLTHGGAGAHTTLTASGATTLTAGTASTTTGTGTLVVTGGIGVSGAVSTGAAVGINLTAGTSGISSVTNLFIGLSGTNSTSPIFINDNGNFRLRSDYKLTWNSQANQSGGGEDVGLARNGAGIIEVNSGTAGTFRDLKIRDVTPSGDVICATAGKGLQLKSGTGARAGNAVLVGGTVTVSNTTVTANTVVLMNLKTAGGTLGSLTYTLSAGASFTITSSSAIDTSTVSYMLFELN